MPTPGQGRLWHCSRCGLGNFRDYNEAQQHEMLCDPFSGRKRRRPASPMGNSSMNQSINFKVDDHQPYFPTDVDQQHQAQQLPAKTPMREPRFKPCIFMPSTEPPPENLSPLDVITCQNVEVFKASAADVADHEGSSGMTVHKGQMGFRCIHCAKNPFAKAEYSAVFPGSLGRVAASLHLMTKFHFQNCATLNQETRNHLQSIRSTFHPTEEDEEWYNDAFVEHSLEVCKRMNIANRSPPQTGIVLGDSKKSSSSSIGGDSRYSSSGDPIMQSTSSVAKANNDNQQSLTHFSSMSNTSQQYPMSNQLKSDEKQSIGRETSPSIGTVPTRSGSPPSLYDSPGSVNFPYFQNQQGFWECRFCWGYPFNQRPQGCFWQSTQPPNRSFMEQHLHLCQNYVMNQNITNQPQTQMLQQQNQFDMNMNINMNQPWLTPKSKQPQFSQNPSLYNSPQSNRPPIPRPPSVPPNFSGTEGMNPQEAYAYQQMQMFNQMQMYQGGADFNQNFNGIQQGGFPGQPMDQCLMVPFDQPPKAAIGARSDAALKATIEYLEEEEKRIESQKKDSDDEDNERELVLLEDKSLLTDYFFHIMKQLRFCRFSESDRKTRGGKRDNIKVGFGGLKCVHCSDSQNSRKFFWSNVDRLANSFAEIPSHVLKCRRCPVQTKQALQALKQRHSEQMTQLPRGSQKVFFRRMWRRLHDMKDDQQSSSTNVNQQTSKDDKSADDAATSTDANKDDRSSQGNIIVGMSTECAAKALADYASGIKPYTRILLAIDEDKSWLSDMDCFIRSNLEVFCASKYDIEFAESDRKYPITEGQIGIRCIHCATSKGGARGTSVAFPPFINGIYESVREFHRVHLTSCPHLPDKSKNKLQTLKGSSSLSSVLRKYYVEAAEALGIYDTDEGMRGGGETKPFGWKDESNKNLSESIRQIESSNQEYFSIHGQEPVSKKRKIGGNP